MLPMNPAPSATLDEIGARAHAASLAYREAFEKFLTGYDDSGWGRDTTERMAREAFERSEEGAKLASASLETMRAHNAARELGDTLDLGEVFHMKELSQAARDRVYATVAEHGRPNDWPAEVRESVHVLLKTQRMIRYDQAAATRRQSLSYEAQVAAARIVEARGGDPTAWTADDLDEVGRAAGRLAAFDILTNRAGAVDIEWGNRRTLANPEKKQ